MNDSFKVEWIDRGREPQCPPNPAYPNGIDVDGPKIYADEFGLQTCSTALPCPAKRCGYYYVQCKVCGTSALITTAGRPDDPRSVHMICKLEGTKQ